MAREYVDLLTYPMGSGGIDTPSRLAWIASELGYSIIGIFTRRRDITCASIAGTTKITVADVGTKAARRSDLRIARGKAARRAASGATADFILPEPKDTVTIKFAAENDVPVAYPYAHLLREHSTRRSFLLRLWSITHDACRRHDCKELLVSAAPDSYLMRDPRDMVALISSCLHVKQEDALNWVSSNPLEIIQIAEERKGGLD